MIIRLLDNSTHIINTTDDLRNLVESDIYEAILELIEIERDKAIEEYEEEMEEIEEKQDKIYNEKLEKLKEWEKELERRENKLNKNNK